MKGAAAHAPPGPAADFPSGSSHRVLLFFSLFFFFLAKILNENHRKTSLESSIPPPISLIPSSPLSFMQNVMKRISLSLSVTKKDVKNR